MPMTMREILAALNHAIPDAGVWWPGDTRFEILAGAILTQNTTWTSVEKALTNLKDLNLLSPVSLRGGNENLVQEAIRPSGYWRAKASYLANISTWFITNDPAASSFTDAELRRSLLGVRGVGEETADDILLYAYNRGVFIYDAYGRRLLSAAGWGEFLTYKAARLACDDAIRAEELTVSEYGLLHGLIVQAGKNARVAGGWDTYWPMVIGS
ncbi:MAG: deoxyribonuclease [Arcanobacterium sp.]|nr:deoxyribonuclease [Arcanobacterium sp.]